MSDHAGVLSVPERARLESLLAEKERATGAQMLIALFPSLEGENLEDFSIRLAQRWRAGQRGLDNGVILLAFIADRRLRLEVGYGLEARLPDAAAGRIIRESLAPRFREGRYAAGLEAAVAAVYALVEPTGAVSPAPRPATGPGRMGLALLFVLAVVVVAVLASVRAARRTPSAYTAGRGGWSAPPPVVFPPGGWGGWRGGGGGGGGFSPGGGSFGGGGASGDW